MKKIWDLEKSVGGMPTGFSLGSKRAGGAARRYGHYLIKLLITA